jgi:hypothetical protein
MTPADPKSSEPRGDDAGTAKTPAQGSQVQGEGNYTAAREYNQATRNFVESGKVEDAAEAAAPDTEAQAEELREAEAEGRRHLKEEDPQVDAGRSRQHPSGGA